MEPAPHSPAPDPSFRLPSLFQQKPSALLFQLLQAGLPAIVLGSLSVILGPLREDQTARKTLGSYKMFVIFVCCVEQKRHSGDSALFGEDEKAPQASFPWEHRPSLLWNVLSILQCQALPLWPGLRIFAL